MGLLKEFKEFAVKGNVIDLAIGVIIGAAFGKIVSSLVDDVVMPLINPILPSGGWEKLVIGPGIKIGNFLSVSLNFIIVAFVLFLVIKAVNSMKKKEAASPVVPPAVTTSEKLLMEIRDSLAAKP
ncbi:MAG: large conductance mechanosensitive channel protein MscL [Chitinophagaceae bacterium]